MGSWGSALGRADNTRVYCAAEPSGTVDMLLQIYFVIAQATLNLTPRDKRNIPIGEGEKSNSSKNSSCHFELFLSPLRKLHWSLKFRKSY